MAQKLTDKQLTFVNEYLRCWNGAEAARRAGYSEHTARQIATENLAKPYIREYIEEAIKENAMSTEEALIRLSQQARATMADFIMIKNGLPFLDLEKAEKADKLHLLKKFKTTPKGVEIELYDSQSALVHIIREMHLKAGEFTESINLQGLIVNISPDSE